MFISNKEKKYWEKNAYISYVQHVGLYNSMMMKMMINYM